MIFTLETRGNVMLEVIQSVFNITPINMRNIINTMHEGFCDSLKSKGVNYNELRSVLTPSRDKKEILLIFDTNKIQDMFYGYTIFSMLIKSFDKKSVNSFLCGDYIDIINNQEVLKKMLLNYRGLNIKEYIHSSQFFFIYINNISRIFLERIEKELKDLDFFVGTIDITYSSQLKDYCSFILVNSFIKFGNKILMAHEQDRDLSENINMCGYPFEEYGFEINSFPEDLFGLFMCYKIQRNTFGESLTDIGFSINAISKDIKNINNFNIRVDEKKFEYLKKEKEGVIKRLELNNISTNELEKLIKSKIRNNYIFNLDYLEDHDVSKFNVLLEFEIKNQEEIKYYKSIAALEYKAATEELGLITFF